MTGRPLKWLRPIQDERELCEADSTRRIGTKIQKAFTGNILHAAPECATNRPNLLAKKKAHPEFENDAP
jgi:hypothetical protein